MPDVYQTIADKIVAQIEQGAGGWRMRGHSKKHGATERRYYCVVPEQVTLSRGKSVWARIVTTAMLSACVALPAAGGQKPMIITIETVPAAEMRYPSAGDWQFKPDGSLHIAVARMSDHRYEFLLALHELVEALLCRESGVSQAAVDAFDRRYEAHRAADDKDSEPGDDPKAPYRREHAIASVTERLAADLLKIDWNRYGAEVASK